MYRRTVNARTQRGVSVFQVVAYTCAAVLCWGYQEAAPAILFPLCAAFSAGAMLSFLDWIRTEATLIYQATEKPETLPDEVRIVEAVRGMDANQVWLTAYMLGYRVDEPMRDEPATETIEGTEIIKSFAISQTDRAARNSGKLAPVRSFSDGTPDRRQMEMLVDWLVKNGMAEPAAGPNPARVTDTTRAKERIING